MVYLFNSKTHLAAQVTFITGYVYSARDNPAWDVLGFLLRKEKVFTGTALKPYTAATKLNSDSAVHDKNYLFGFIPIGQTAHYRKDDRDILMDMGYTHREKVLVCEELFKHVSSTDSLNGCKVIDRGGAFLDATIGRISRAAGGWEHYNALNENHHGVLLSTIGLLHNHFLKRQLSLLKLEVKKGPEKPDFHNVGQLPPGAARDQLTS